NEDAFRRGTKIRLFATHDDEAKVIMHNVPTTLKRMACRQTVSPPVLEFHLVLRRFRLAEQRTCTSVDLRIALLSKLSNPTVELISIEMAISAVGERCKGASFEQNLGIIGPLSRTLLVPATGKSPHRSSPRASKQPHDIDLMSCLAEDNTATEACVELLRTT